MHAAAVVMREVLQESRSQLQHGSTIAKSPFHALPKADSLVHQGEHTDVHQSLAWRSTVGPIRQTAKVHGQQNQFKKAVEVECDHDTFILLREAVVDVEPQQLAWNKHDQHDEEVHGEGGESLAEACQRHAGQTLNPFRLVRIKPAPSYQFWHAVIINATAAEPSIFCYRFCMEYLNIDDRQVSRIGLGTWAIGASEWANVDRDASIACLRRAFDEGINLIDTAPIYGSGHSEEIVGEAIAQHIASGGGREELYIATKFGLDRERELNPGREPHLGRVVTNAHPQYIAEELERSLRRLRLDYIDLYQLHWPDPLIPMEQVAETLLPLLQSGRVRALGVSNCSIAQMTAFRSIAPLVSNQPPYNIYERAIEHAVLPWCDAHGIATLAYSALCRSMLSGRVTEHSTFTDIRKFDPKFHAPRLAQYAAATAALDEFAQQSYGKRVVHLAIRWILDRSPHALALWGAHKPQQLDDIAMCLGWRLTPEDMKAIDAIVAEHVTDPVGPEYLTPGVRRFA